MHHHNGKLRVGIVGGSISGCAAALLMALRLLIEMAGRQDGRRCCDECARPCWGRPGR